MSSRDRAQGDGVERRSTPGTIEARAGGGSSVGTISGKAILFNVEADIGPFVESIAPAAVDGVLDGADIVSIVNHDPNRLLGRTAAGTMRVRVGSDGVRYSVDLPNTTAGRDTRESVRRGDLRGSSFGFRVAENGEVWDKTPAGKPRRRIVKFAKIYDLSPVTSPAYLDTSVSARSLDRASELAEGQKRGSGGHRAHLAALRAEVDRIDREAAADIRALTARIDAERPMTVAEGRRILAETEGRLGLYGKSFEPARMSDRERRRAAHHEAGHGLAVVLSGGRITELTLDCCRWEFAGSRSPRGCLLSLSGRAAENVFAGERGYVPREGTSDHRWAAARLRKLGLAPVDEWIRREVAYAESLVDFYQPAVTALAEVLYRRGSVSGTDAEQILTRSIAREAEARWFAGDEPRWGAIVTPAMRARK